MFPLTFTLELYRGVEIYKFNSCYIAVMVFMSLNFIWRLFSLQPHLLSFAMGLNPINLISGVFYVAMATSQIAEFILEIISLSTPISRALQWSEIKNSTSNIFCIVIGVCQVVESILRLCSPTPT